MLTIIHQTLFITGDEYQVVNFLILLPSPIPYHLFLTMLTPKGPTSKFWQHSIWGTLLGMKICILEAYTFIKCVDKEDFVCALNFSKG